MCENHHVNPFLRRRVTPTDLPPDFMEVWNYFETLENEDPKEIGFDLHGLVFEKTYSPNAGLWLISCRAKRLSNTATALAYMKIEEGVVQYRAVNIDEWTILNTADMFVDKLFDLIDDQENQRQFYMMQLANDKPFFSGFFHADEPYEIDDRSVKFAVSDTQCDLLLEQKEKKDAPDNILDLINASIINNLYPKTSMVINPDARRYKFITFNGFLYSPVEIIPGEGGLFSFKARFIRDMKM